MSEPTNHSDDWYSPDEMRDWLKVENVQVRLASARRIGEAQAIVEAYSEGRLTCEEANCRLEEHERKWGEVALDLGLASEIHEAAVCEVYRLKKRGAGQSDRGERLR